MNSYMYRTMRGSARGLSVIFVKADGQKVDGDPTQGVCTGVFPPQCILQLWWTRREMGRNRSRDEPFLGFSTKMRNTAVTGKL